LRSTRGRVPSLACGQQNRVGQSWLLYCPDGRDPGNFLSRIKLRESLTQAAGMTNADRSS